MPNELLEDAGTVTRHVAACWRDQRMGWTPIRTLQRSLGDFRHAEYWRGIDDERWSDVEARARADLARRTAARDAIDHAAEALGRRLAERDDIEESLGAIRRAAARLPTDAAGFDPAVRDIFVDQGMTLAEVNAVLDQIHSGFLGSTVPDRGIADAQLAQLLAVHKSNAVGTATSTLAFAIARFNLAVSNPPTPRRDQGELESALAAAYRHLRDALRAGNTGDVLAASGSLSTVGRGVAASAIELAASVQVDSPGTSVGEIRRHARFALGAAELIRDGTLARVVGLETRWCAQLGDESRALRSWRDAATELELRSALREPTTRSISSLRANPRRRDNEDISVIGQVASVGERRIGAGGAKLVSTISIDDGTGNAVDVVLPHIHLDSGGLVSGCWARVSGVWRASSAEHGGSPALEARRLPLGALATESFREYARHRVRDRYEPIAHGLDLAFSWTPGTDGPGNQIRYDTMRASS